MRNTLLYEIGLNWTGTVHTDKKYRYDKTYELNFKEKPSLQGSADAVFHGDSQLYNPEEMLLSALSSCHMMSFFYLCSVHKLVINSYNDHPIGKLKINPNGSGQFEEVLLQPTIQSDEKNTEKLKELFEQATDYCFIARSCNFKITHQPVFKKFS